MKLREMKRVNPVILVMLTFAVVQTGCGVNQPSADEIISKAIEKHGGALYSNAEVQFDFRGKTYQTKIVNDQVEVHRMYETEDGQVMDMLQGKEFVRRVNSKEISLDAGRKEDLYNDANSVVYFALLPYRLNDPAVNKQLMCTQDVEGEPYYKVEITFDANGGGEDFEDSFIYWIHKKNYTVDYLAYSFHINGGGVRFRKAYNQREVNGIRFQDYVNYTIDTDFPAHELDFAFETGKLRELSRIDLEDIRVDIK
jgi:hypothetical protein